MKKINYKTNFSDQRGEIIDMLENEKINAVTLIESNKKSIRGNHYHKKTWQWNYILNGRIKLITQRFGKKKTVHLLKKGDFILLGPMEKHAFYGLSDYSMLVFTKGPRGGKEYENDTFRLKKKLL
jgi:quercetin dioxygenase-like cupin family protein